MSGLGRGLVLILLRLFDKVLRALACLLLGSLLCCVMAGIVTRACGQPLSWTDEASRFLMAWLAGTGWMIAGRSNAHVRIRFFHNLLPSMPWKTLEVVIQSTTVLFGLSIAAFGVKQVILSSSIDATSLPVSMAWLYFPVIPAALLIAGQGVGNLVRHRTWRPGKDAGITPT
jgi:TRAP-type C4-dicarboxylate transport system permease small subunit